jgi:WhiB family redox-sensing transcriptional regulator
MASARPETALAWQDRSACTGVDTNLFFEPEAPRLGRVNQRLKTQREDAAKRICAGCPVAAQCLAWAEATGQAYGIWGGLNALERAARRAAARRTQHRRTTRMAVSA